MLTPRARGAVASVLVDGPQAEAIAQRLFDTASGRPLGTEAIGNIIFGRWRTTGEELVVCRRAPGRLEIHCHGGSAAVRSVVETLVSAGCQSVPWTEWLTIGAADPLTAAASIALAGATTGRTAAILLDQRAGALRTELRELERELRDGRLAQAGARLAMLRGRSRVGMHLVDPFKLVIAGPANAGKSTLANALLGYQRAIVDERPGTTRDLVTAPAAVDGWPVELVDTAGMRAAGDSVEAEGIARARARLETADLVLLVFDSSLDWDAAADELLARSPDAIIIHNKSDLVAGSRSERPPGHAMSAKTAQGLEELLVLIGQRLVPDAPRPGAAVPFLPEHYRWLKEVAEHLSAGSTATAIAVLGQFGVC